MHILFLAKDKPFSKEAAEMVRQIDVGAKVYFGERTDAFPMDILDEEFDFVISYICPWIVPGDVLGKTKRAAINFHPGPPEYPGIGCTNFAIYNGEREYGVTAHLMTERVDAGPILAVERFAVKDDDTVFSLTQRCYEHIFNVYKKIMNEIVTKNRVVPCSERWKRKPFTRKELNDLCRITEDMDEDEVKRRIRATEYPGMPGAYLEKDGTYLTLDKNGAIQKK